ncbi:MAG: hypothetical protein WBA28_02805 [Microbacteriaceae bacterium]
MTITAEEVGRDLHITVEGLEPYVIKPLVGKYGETLTQAFIKFAVDGLSDQAWSEALLGAMDGFTENGEPNREGVNQNRLINELRLAEAERVLFAAFLWQTVMGIGTVQEYLSNPDTMDGSLKAMRALAFKLGLSAWMKSPDTESENVTPVEDTNTTSSPQSSKTVEKLPWHKRSRLPKGSVPKNSGS